LPARGDDLLAKPDHARVLERAAKATRPVLGGDGAANMLAMAVRTSGRVSGYAFGFLRIEDLMRLPAGVDGGALGMKVVAADGTVLMGGGAPGGARLSSARSLELGGERWTIIHTSTPTLETQLAGRLAETIGVFGALGSFLLFGLVRVLSGTREQAQQIARRTTQALSDQVRMNEDVIELNPVPMFRKGVDGRYRQFNRAWERLTGRSRDECVGRSTLDLPAEEELRLDELATQVIADPDRVGRTELSLTTAAGESLALIVSMSAVRLADGTVDGVVGSVTDLTEMRRLAAQNENQREQLALVNQSAQAGVWDIEWPQGTAYFSPRYFEMLGYSPGPDGGLPGARSELVHPEDRARVEAAREAHFSGREPYFDCEYRLRRADGSFLWVNGRGLASLDGQGRPVRFTGSIIDITQRRMAQMEIERQREQLELVIESVQAGVWDENLIGGDTHFSRRYREILAYADDDVPGSPWEDAEAFHPDDRESVMAARETAIRDGSPLDLEFRMRRRDGLFVWVNARAKASYDSAGYAIRFTGAIIDISTRKEAEFALRDANLRALEAAQAKSTFLATMSHEIRTPLNGVIGSADLLADTRLNAEQQDYVQTIRLSGVQLLTLIDDILDFSKIESGRMELEDEPFDVATVIEDAFDLVAERARSKRLELLYDVAPDVPRRVRGDITRVRQVLINLVGNAVKFTDSGEVYVNCRIEDGDPSEDLPFRLRFTVKDTGIGIPAEKLPRLFSAFSQVDASTTRKYGGTGLGLAISQRLVGLMGGEIGVESEAGAGSSFRFTIRTRRAADDGAAGRRQGEIGSIAGKRVLIVDDYASNRHILAAQCAAWGLFTVEAASVAEALEAITAAHRADTPFDAVITDMLMPEQDGVDLAREIAVYRKLNHARLPVMVLSSAPRAEAFAGREVPERWIEAYLLKPARQAQLFNALLDILAPERPFHLTGPESVPRPGGMQAYSGRLRILLAEDNEINRKIAVRMLERLGKAAEVAVNGREALDMALAQPFDCVLMDVQMPEIDGLEATRRLRESLGPERLPYIVAMTANAMAGDREACLSAGMHDYIAKPVQLASLSEALARAQQYIARRGPADEHAEGSEPAVDANGGDPVPARGDGTLDMSQIDELLGLDDSGEVLDDFVGMYTTQAPQRIDEIAKALETGDLPRVVRVAHSLKGASGNLGAARVADVARRIELAGQGGDADAIGPLVEEIRARYVEVEAALNALRRTPA
jgi:PAS domain S-box-containing protein